MGRPRNLYHKIAFAEQKQTCTMQTRDCNYGLVMFCLEQWDVSETSLTLRMISKPLVNRLKHSPPILLQLHCDA